MIETWTSQRIFQSVHFSKFSYLTGIVLIIPLFILKYIFLMISSHSLCLGWITPFFIEEFFKSLLVNLFVFRFAFHSLTVSFLFHFFEFVQSFIVVFFNWIFVVFILNFFVSQKTTLNKFPSRHCLSCRVLSFHADFFIVHNSKCSWFLVRLILLFTLSWYLPWCGGLNEWPHRHVYSNTWSPVGETVCEGWRDIVLLDWWVPGGGLWRFKRLASFPAVPLCFLFVDRDANANSQQLLQHCASRWHHASHYDGDWLLSWTVSPK